MLSPKPAMSSVVVAFVTVTLVACTPSPEPDAALVELHRDALHDAEALLQSAPTVATLRTEHADEIDEEIRRLCGYTDEGMVPESCNYELPAIAAASEEDVRFRISDSQVRMLNRLDELPVESIPLITEHYIEQAGLSPEVPDIDVADGVSLAGEDLTAAQDLLAEEYAAAWALGVALAYVAPEHGESTQNAIDHHRDYAAILRTTIEPFAETAPSEPGYDLGDLTDPVDPETALAMITEVQQHAVASWHSTAGEATDAGWRSLATQIAGATARDTVPFA